MKHHINALEYMRNWIIDREEINKKKLANWQFLVSCIGIFVSVIAVLLLLPIATPLALSALIPLGFSILLPLFFHSVPFSNEPHIIKECTKKFEIAIAETIRGMNLDMRVAGFDGPVLDDNLRISIVTSDNRYSKIFMRCDEGKIGFFFSNDEPIVPPASVVPSQPLGYRY